MLITTHKLFFKFFNPVWIIEKSHRSYRSFLSYPLKPTCFAEEICHETKSTDSTLAFSMKKPRIVNYGE